MAGGWKGGRTAGWRVAAAKGCTATAAQPRGMGHVAIRGRACGCGAAGPEMVVGVGGVGLDPKRRRRKWDGTTVGEQGQTQSGGARGGAGPDLEQQGEGGSRARP